MDALPGLPGTVESMNKRAATQPKKYSVRSTRALPAPAETTAMNKLTATQSPDPRHVYLSQSDLQTRYGRGRTFISQLVNSPGFPRPIVPGRWRFDRILAREDVQA
ncbi:MAG: hypothetical protein ACRDYV_13880, partial [Acidimicrobiia bacterium]